MSKQLGTLVLPEELQWLDENQHTPVTQETRRTLGGSLVVFSSEINRGRDITISSEDGISWLTEAQVAEIQSMAAQAGATFTLTWGSAEHTVIFRHNDPPAVDLRPIAPNFDLFVGTIKLTTV